MKRKFISVILAIFILWGIMPSGAFAAIIEPDLTPELKPDESGIYHIASADNWTVFCYMVNNGNTFKNKTVVLDDNIVAAQPAGSTDKPFSGIFDAQKNSIELSFNDNTGSNKGVFSFTADGAVIKNLNVKGTVSGDYNIGGIVGNASATVFQNCISNVTLNGTSCAGGIAGLSDSGTAFNRCISYGNVTANENAGGIVGKISTNKSGEFVSTFLNCISTGYITAETYAGGIIGCEGGAVSVKNSHTFGIVTAISEGYGITGCSAEGSTYESCIYNEDDCPEDIHGEGCSCSGIPVKANEYTEANNKAAEEWLNLGFDSESRPVFVSAVITHPAAEPKCVTPGHPAYYELDGEFYTDYACTEKIENTDIWLSEKGDGYIKPTGHDYVAELKKPATCTENGLRIYYCNRCDISFEEIIARTGIHSWYACDSKIHKCENCTAIQEHTYTNGKCICGKAEPGVNTDYFYFKNTGSVTATVSWRNPSSYSVANLEYSINDKSSFERFEGTLELSAGDICYFRGWNENLSDIRVVCNTLNASLAAGGDIGTLLNETGNITKYPDYAFCNIFFNLDVLTDISDLTLCRKDTELGYRCFAGMFIACMGLTEIPDNFLPATTLSEGCYKNMFESCTGLVKVPEKLLPATALKNQCYYSMFSHCKKLQNAPDLPASELCDECYQLMFYECTSLASVKVAFTKWDEQQKSATFLFLPVEVNETLNFYCTYDLDTDSRGDYSISKNLSVNIIKYCDVQLVAAGGRGGTASVTVLYGEALPPVTVPTRKGYTFAGYYDFNGIKYYNSDGTSPYIWYRTDFPPILIAYWNTAHEHTFSAEWSTSSTHHWHTATCDHTDNVSGFGVHTFDESGKCTVCKYEKTGTGAKKCTVTLTGIENPEKIYTGTTDENGLCSIGNIENGKYLLAVSCEGTVTRTYTTEVTDGTVTQAITLYEDGDINGDGEINVKDYQNAVNTALGNETKVSDDLTKDEDYRKAVADLDKDGYIDVIDISLLERKISAVISD